MSEAENLSLLRGNQEEYGEQYFQVSDEQKNKAEKAIRSVLIASFFYFFPVAITIAVRPSIMLTASDNDTKRAALFSSAVDATNALVAGLTSPFLGSLSDSKGRVPVLQICAAAEAFGLILVIIFKDSLLGQFIAYQFIGFASSSQATLQTGIADVSLMDPEQSTKAFARLNQVLAAAFFIGPVLGGYLASKYTDVLPIKIAAITLVVAVPFFRFYLIETRPDKELVTRVIEPPVPRISLRESIQTIRSLLTSNNALMLLIISQLVESLGENGAFSIMFMYTNERLNWDAEKVGIFISAIGLQMFLTQELSQRTVKYFGERYVLVFGYFSLAIHYLVYAVASKAWLMWTGLAVGIPGFISYPVSQVVITRQVDMSMQGQLQGAFFSLSNLIQPLSSIGTAVLFSIGTAYGMPGMVFLVIACCSFVASYMANLGMKHPELK